MENRKIRVAITHGDTNGIGYELIFKAFAEPEMLELCTPIIYGSPKIAAYHRKALDIPGNFTIINSVEEATDGRLNLLPCFDEEVKVEFGTPTEESGRAALKAIDKAMTDFRTGTFDVLVAAPICNHNIQGEGFKFPGHREYIETSLDNGKNGLMVFVNDHIRTIQLTHQMALHDVSKAVTAENIEKKVTLFFESLRRDFNISNPRIAVLSLNPLCKDGNWGEEEKSIIIPAIQTLFDEKRINVFGPYAADVFFEKGSYQEFDGVVAMYHDQAAIPLSILTAEPSVKLLTGLPLVCTAVNTDSCFDIAGKNMCEADSFRRAIYLAIDVLRNRERYQEPLANPLPKLYHEKRDESEKVRFSVQQKRESGKDTPRSKKSQKSEGDHAVEAKTE
ncbi:4-hydroxythreonine-4-phosphate dehydrogenase PdxA [Prevotella sp. A2931]|uniref:4-hydroxythreonine-4-phosphate dehydrogenase PdxA n=1 Tax=Prevotella illustrans TaxID=2800387 RepID=A0ABS3M4D8_9BACT|nr:MULTISPECIES: 4-hydroxythreonine-4-phosphate dehydrogenase PdxA [Prevotella]MBO1362956.1 4-hydroxythreonine-4-phosphate dehydrogenase PdxA [Prevotella illustrans]PTL27140.1 4-hydroxythreonine-4-phosphate dehydrogenase [Prevotella sp. oral taxon 820]